MNLAATSTTSLSIVYPTLTGATLVKHASVARPVVFQTRIQTIASHASMFLMSMTMPLVFAPMTLIGVGPHPTKITVMIATPSLPLVKWAWTIPRRARLYFSAKAVLE